MARFFVLLICILTIFGVVAAQDKTARAQDQNIRVEKIVAATSVDNHEPVGENKEFAASVGTVYCWTKVSSKAVPAAIKHVWYLGDKKVFEHSLDLKFNSTRTWSSKSVRPGSWRVDVTDEAGMVLASTNFSVK